MLTNEQIEQAKQYRSEGYSLRVVAAWLGVSHQAVAQRERKGWTIGRRPSELSTQVLAMLELYPGLTARDLANMSRRSASVVTATLRTLEASGKVHAKQVTTLPYNPLVWYLGPGEPVKRRALARRALRADAGPVTPYVLVSLSEAPASASTLAQGCGISHHIMLGVVRALTELGLVTREERGQYTLTMRGDKMRETLEQREGAK